MTIPSDLSSLLIQLTDLQIASVAIHRINAIANLPAEALANEDALSSEGRAIRCNDLLEFKDVTLKYSKEAEPALDRISFKLPAGRKIGSELLYLVLMISIDVSDSMRAKWQRKEHVIVLSVSTGASRGGANTGSVQLLPLWLPG